MVNYLTSITVEYRPFSILFPETLLKSLSNSVNIVTVNVGSDFEVVIAVDHVVSVGRKDCCVVLLSDNAEVKGVRRVLKTDSGSRNRVTEVCPRIDGEDSLLRDFETRVVWVCDFEAEVVETHAMVAKAEGLDDGTGGLEVVVIGTRVGKGQSDGGSVALGVSHFVL